MIIWNDALRALFTCMDLVTIVAIKEVGIYGSCSHRNSITYQNPDSCVTRISSTQLQDNICQEPHTERYCSTGQKGEILQGLREFFNI